MVIIYGIYSTFKNAINVLYRTTRLTDLLHNNA